MIRTMRPAALFLVFLVTAVARAEAADQWIEVKSAHFTLTSSASEGATKTLAWQLEQIRSAISVLWPWAKVDLNKPLSVFVVKDETSMRAMAPSYWEQKGGMRPATIITQVTRAHRRCTALHPTPRSTRPNFIIGISDSTFQTKTLRTTHCTALVRTLIRSRNIGRLQGIDNLLTVVRRER